MNRLYLILEEGDLYDLGLTAPPWDSYEYLDGYYLWEEPGEWDSSDWERWHDLIMERILSPDDYDNEWQRRKVHGIKVRLEEIADQYEYSFEHYPLCYPCYENGNEDARGHTESDPHDEDGYWTGELRERPPPPSVPQGNDTGGVEVAVLAARSPDLSEEPSWA